MWRTQAQNRNLVVIIEIRRLLRKALFQYYCCKCCIAIIVLFLNKRVLLTLILLSKHYCGSEIDVSGTQNLLSLLFVSQSHYTFHYPFQQPLSFFSPSLEKIVQSEDCNSFVYFMGLGTTWCLSTDPLQSDNNFERSNFN